MIEWIVTSSALILLVLVLRLLIKDRVSPRLRYALWALVLLRLLVPGTLWESKASVMAPVAAQEVYREIERIERAPRDILIQEDGSAVVYDQTPYGTGTRLIPAEVVRSGEPAFVDTQDQRASSVAQMKRTVDMRKAVLYCWWAGAAIVGVVLLWVNLHFWFDLRRRRRPKEAYRGRSVYTDEVLPTPCLFGLFRPAIYLTPGLTEAEREHVLAHEYTHFRQGDHIWAVLRGVCLAVHWYNPLVWLAAVLSRRDCELSCDEGAVRLLGEERRADYGRTLVGLVARRTTAADLACCATTMTGGKSALKERIALLVKQPRTTAVMACIVAAACAVFAVCTFTGAAEAEESPVDPDAPVQSETEPAPEDVVLLPLPDDLPTELMDMSRPVEEQGEWLLLAQWPEADAALYRTGYDDSKVYLRWGEEFQMFEQDLSKLDMLPEMERASYGEGWGVAVWYKRHEGTYFNGETYEPGVVADYVLYGREEGYWKASSPSTGRLEPYLPALEDLPTESVWDIPGGYMDPILLLAELPEEDIAVYYDQQSFYPGGLIRYEDHLQRVEEIFSGDGPAKLYFEDMDGDGEKELAVIYVTGRGTGTYTTGLTVYEWDGESWTGHTANLELDIIDDFNVSRTFTLYPEEGRAVVGYDGSEVDVDMVEMFGNRSLWTAEPVVCEMMGTICNYRRESYGLILEILGEIRPAGYAPTTCYGFGYTRNVYYEEDGTFRSTWGRLWTDYPWSPKLDESRLTPTFRRILQDFIEERCQAWGDEDISRDKFAILDVNGDGQDELITQVNNDSMAGQVELVYDGDGNQLLAEYPAVTYYDNGYAVAEWSHNQGRAGDKLWPYTLLRFDADVGKYVRIASVDGWDRALGEESFLGEVPYPYDVDKDGDGFVYYIITEEGGYAPVYGEPMDYSDYALWVASYLGGNVVEVPYVWLTEETIALIQ